MSTNNESTFAWIAEFFNEDEGNHGQHERSIEPWWGTPGMQSDKGILLKVEDEGLTMSGWRKITELLLYAAVVLESESLPTPPGSSSPGRFGDAPELSDPRPKAVRVYALPLSSTVLNQTASSINTVTPPSEDLERLRPACFLPYPQNQSQAGQRTQQKRQSLSLLFDDATQKRRKLRGRGGESVAQAMANIDRTASQNCSIETKSESRNRSLKSASENKAQQSLLRTSSMTSINGQDPSQPASHSGALTDGKRSSLHRVESAASPLDSCISAEVENINTKQNKASLVKIVMAGMRLYGLQQRKKQPWKTQAAENCDTVILNEVDADDEYKLVYHQTLKAATFALRRQFSAQVIPQEIMRDVVDRFLNLFCTDPLVSSALEDMTMPGFSSQG